MSTYPRPVGSNFLGSCRELPYLQGTLGAKAQG